MLDKPLTPGQLIEDFVKIDDYVKSETKRFAAFLAPFKEQMEKIENQLLEMLNKSAEGDKASFSCDAGTAYISNLLNVKIDPEAEPYQSEHGVETGRDALLAYCLDHWDEIGNEMLLYQPQKDAVRKYLEENGKPPPGVKIGWFKRCNIRRT